MRRSLRPDTAEMSEDPASDAASVGRRDGCGMPRAVGSGKGWSGAGGPDGAPLRDCLLWMDARSATEAEDILEMGAGDPALRVNSGGAGPISAEWMLPKALWLKKHERDIYDAASVICECQDWLNHKCTGKWVAGGCNVATRWHCDGKAACEEVVEGRFGGRPSELLRKCGLEALEEKWPRTCVAMGQPAGTLTKAAAAHLGLRKPTLDIRQFSMQKASMAGTGSPISARPSWRRCQSKTVKLNSPNGMPMLLSIGAYPTGN